MIRDADSVPNGACLRPDVCVVGGGAAGIALALSLTGRGLQVLLLEGGHAAHHAPTQSLYDGEVADERLHSPPDRYRQRRMGGSTTTWGGRCMPFDAIDFETRTQVPDSGWPISLQDLLPFYPQANALAEAGRFSYDASEALGETAPPMIRGFDSPLVRTNGLERFSCPTDFGRRYARRLKVAPDIDVLLGANCTAIRLQPDGRAVRELEVATLAGRRFSVAARACVLAIGGLETARLLLASRDIAPAGVGNDHDVVGRYYMCHIAGNVGTLVVNGAPQNVRHGYEVTPEGI
ncbi:MAG TPA: FAD-dependent oxidoreductase, partial [Ramlibacter sp.]|nr:FAD-dependent oxidoreductase [Ramlibacter sp.]